MSRVGDNGPMSSDLDFSAQPESPPCRVLVVEDHEQAGQTLARLLERDPRLQVALAADGRQALDQLQRHPFSLVITDLRMPALDGMDLIREVRQRKLPVTVIVTTGHGGVREAVQAIRLGAYDFLTKPLDLDALRLVIDRALSERALQDEVQRLRAQVRGQSPFPNLLSKSPRMLALFELIRTVAETTATVLVEGETGTGKEQVARAIHQASRPLRRGDLVAVNCAALPETLLESELFGHEKGSFTGAVTQRKGRFELAYGGTLLLDEVGDIPPAMQAKLLRVLQERKFERVGGTESIDADVRVVAATNRPLAQLVRRGRLRKDLYYRLNVVKIELPPLRERPEDIPLLAEHFAAKYARPGEAPVTFSPEAMDLLLGHSWAGNIRELENVIERACVTSHVSVISAKHLAIDFSTKPRAGNVLIDLRRPLSDYVKDTVAQVERQYITKALRRTNGHVGRCARICGLSRRCITNKLIHYQINKDEFKELVGSR